MSWFTFDTCILLENVRENQKLYCIARMMNWTEKCCAIYSSTNLIFVKLSCRFISTINFSLQLWGWDLYYCRIVYRSYTTVISKWFVKILQIRIFDWLLQYKLRNTKYYFGFETALVILSSTSRVKELHVKYKFPYVNCKASFCFTHL